MLDFLFALGQFVCVLGLIYGFILMIAHANCVDSMRAHYDPIAGHDWLAIKNACDEPEPGVCAASESRSQAPASSVSSLQPRNRRLV